MDAHIGGARFIHDDPRVVSVLWRPGALEECSRHVYAELRPGRDHYNPVDRHRLYAGIRQWHELYRRFAVDRPEWRRRRSQCGLRGDDPTPDLHVLSADVRHHHPGLDDGRICGTNEVLQFPGVLSAVGNTY